MFISDILKCISDINNFAFYPKQIKAVSLSKTYKQEKVTKTL